ncbi:putative FBD domain, F-box-like domain superfamily protein [Helianthus annuus]|nr:putative FBD domain, leucine-rich repeat domain superfamily, F-box-like domain superfamily [Helianthus annuus]KAJ0446940.1 putative FBD domain, leucine-rich repeat domain superfamily, F-box-like domain superfamily [Helianthus annuus]KAJ0631839.1 putative FBD domain, leucine-rich repeat domain superfamily, F-box-like domain superfamily [Helianthus annuus]KAJ0635740.1 putative FBD domain, leucine-rich repeat domain superfamily, F-box-like domain superfamily [Helianthus annuus]KAJ0812515.1 puta
MIVKRVSKAQGFDLITTLPQAIIETILCLLPIEEAARTSILSRAWRYKWTTIPKLWLCLASVKRPSYMDVPDWWNHVSNLERARRAKNLRCKLFYAIHQVLLLRQGPIHEFTLAMDAHDTCFEIDQIILHLSRNHPIKKLRFFFYGFTAIAYGLPLSFFSLDQLADLDLEHCAFNYKPIFSGFSSLTRLSLKSTRIYRETLLHLLSNCPSLKSLCLLLYEDDVLSDEKPSIMELFKCLPVLEHLTTWGYFIEVLVQASVPEEPPTSLIHLRYVCIEEMCFVDGYGLPFLVVLTRSCPNLEKIKLLNNTAWDDEIESSVLEECSVLLEEYSDVWLEHLNELEIKHFEGFAPELEFVKFILARSPNLKKVILLTDMDDKDEELELLKNLLSAPRASPVQIIVKYC